MEQNIQFYINTYKEIIKRNADFSTNIKKLKPADQMSALGIENISDFILFTDACLTRNLMNCSFYPIEHSNYCCCNCDYEYEDDHATIAIIGKFKENDFRCDLIGNTIDDVRDIYFPLSLNSFYNLIQKYEK